MSNRYIERRKKMWTGSQGKKSPYSCPTSSNDRGFASPTCWRSIGMKRIWASWPLKAWKKAWGFIKRWTAFEVGSAYRIHQWRYRYGIRLICMNPFKRNLNQNTLQRYHYFLETQSFLHGFIFNFNRGLFFEALFWAPCYNAVVHVSWCSIAIAGVHQHLRHWHPWYLAMDLTPDLGWAKGYLGWWLPPWTITMLGHDKLYWAMNSQARFSWCSQQKWTQGL